MSPAITLSRPADDGGRPGRRSRPPAPSGGATYVVEGDVRGCASAYSGFEYVATIGRRAFVDRTLPVGATVATYRITARSSTRSGDTAEFNVRFEAADALDAGASGACAA